MNRERLQGEQGDGPRGEGGDTKVTLKHTPSSTLRLQGVPGGLYKVVATDGGVIPKNLRGIYNDLLLLQPKIDKYNRGEI